MVPLMPVQVNPRRNEPVRLILAHGGQIGQNGLNVAKNVAEEPRQSHENVFMENKVGI